SLLSSTSRILFAASCAMSSAPHCRLNQTLCAHADEARVAPRTRYRPTSGLRVFKLPKREKSLSASAGTRMTNTLLRTYCNDVDFHQGATIASGEDDLHRGAGGLVRLLLGAEELGVSGHHPVKIHLATFRGIGPEIHPHHYDVAQRQFLRFEKLLNVSDQTL